MITIESPGGLTLIQDRGRHGFRQLGVGWSGAFDQPAASLANSLVSNDADAAVLEVLLGGLRFGAHTTITLAITGAPSGATVSSEDSIREMPFSQRVEIPSGAKVELGVPTVGMRTYVAFAGGIDVEQVLGSRSSDTLSNLGPRPLGVGQVLSLKSDSAKLRTTPPPASRQSDRLTDLPDINSLGSGTTDLASPDLVAALAASATSLSQSDSGTPTLAASSSPHAELVNGNLAELLTKRLWTVGDRSSRIGVRLSGDPLPIDYPSSWESEPTLPGSIQIAPNGELIIFGPDGPTTGGYPVIAVASAEALVRLSQLRPGSQLRLQISA